MALPGTGAQDALERKNPVFYTIRKKLANLQAWNFCRDSKDLLVMARAAVGVLLFHKFIGERSPKSAPPGVTHGATEDVVARRS